MNTITPGTLFYDGMGWYRLIITIVKDRCNYICFHNQHPYEIYTHKSVHLFQQEVKWDTMFYVTQ